MKKEKELIRDALEESPVRDKKILKQLENLRDWSLDPVKYVENINEGKSYADALENSKKYTSVKDSALYKLFNNPKVIGVEFGHEGIIELINLIQNSGLLKKGGIVKKPKRMTKLDTIDTMYQNMTPIEKGQFNYDLRKRYGYDYIRFKTNNKNIK